MKIDNLFVVLLLFFISCEQHEQVEEKVIVTIEDDTDLEYFYLLTDDFGNFIDSATSKSQKILELSGPVDLRDYTLIKIFEGDDYLIIDMLTEVNYDHWNGSMTSKNTEEPKRVEMVIDPAISGEISFMGGQRIDENKLTYLDNISIEANSADQIAVLLGGCSGTRRYALYENLKDEQLLEIVLSDFTVMKNVEFESQDPIYATEVSGFQNDNTLSYGFKVCQTEELIFNYAPDFFDGYAFDVLFKSGESGQLFESVYFGKKPEEASKMDISDVIYDLNFDSFMIDSKEDNIDVAMATFKNGKSRFWLNAKNGYELNPGLIDLIQQFYPTHNLNFERADQLVLLNLEGIDRDDYNEVVIDPPGMDFNRYIESIRTGPSVTIQRCEIR